MNCFSKWIVNKPGIRQTFRRMSWLNVSDGTVLKFLIRYKKINWPAFDWYRTQSGQVYHPNKVSGGSSNEYANWNMGKV